MATMPVTERRWTCDQYHQMIDAGILTDRGRVELIEGEIVYKLDHCPYAGALFQATGIAPRRLWTQAEVADLLRLGLLEPGDCIELVEGDQVPAMGQKPAHPTAVTLCRTVLSAVFEDGCHVREEKALTIWDGTEPEPDVAVVQGDERAYTWAHPCTALLLVEVADTSLNYDRTIKASIYAKAGIQDYWILNIIDRQLEVHRDPAPMPSATFGYGYQSVQTIPADGFVTPLAKPEAQIAVADLLP